MAIAPEIIAVLLSASDTERLELAAQLVPWRPGPAPENDELPVDGIEITPDGKWWRYLLPGAPPSPC
jgi:hypothetical protein